MSSRLELWAQAEAEFKEELMRSLAAFVEVRGWLEAVFRGVQILALKLVRLWW